MGKALSMLVLIENSCSVERAVPEGISFGKGLHAILNMTTVRCLS
jgi:hypothetical protein